MAARLDAIDLLHGSSSHIANAVLTLQYLAEIRVADRNDMCNFAD
ncbi:hypothetical protein ACVWXN_004893 [Bradyrhizobium sp. i1.4.4]